MSDQPEELIDDELDEAIKQLNRAGMKTTNILVESFTDMAHSAEIFVEKFTAAMNKLYEENPEFATWLKQKLEEEDEEE